MSRRTQQKADRPAAAPDQVPPEPPVPVDMADGIPDRAARPAVWVYVTLGVIFAVWLAVLAYVAMAGTPGEG